MRKLFTSIALLTCFTLFAQDNNFIVKEGGLWSTVEVHCMPNGNNYSTYYTKFEGDTVVEGTDYTIAWISNDELQSEWNIYGFIREDENHAVYVRPPDYIESKIYDFGVAVGDSITARNVYLNSDTLHFVVEQIDSVMMLDRYRKRIVLYEYMNQKEEIWIEGVGSLYGIMNSCNNSYGAVCGGYESLCYEEDGELVYHNENFPACFYSVTVGETEQFVIQDLPIFPNPAKDLVTIDLTSVNSSSNSFDVEFLTITGEKIMVKKLAKNKNVIYLHSLKRGLYFIKDFR